MFVGPAVILKLCFILAGHKEEEEEEEEEERKEEQKPVGVMSCITASVHI